MSGHARVQQLPDFLEGASAVGGIYGINFLQCTVITNDYWKKRAGGLSQFSFLLASCPQDNLDSTDSTEIILLRIIDVAPLPHERELTATRLEAVKDIVEQGGREEVDALTMGELQWSGLNCQIVGTFYEESGNIRWGSDVDNVYSGARYAVYKPSAEVLSYIVSYTDDPDGASILLGHVRYASTERRSRENGYDKIPVYVPVTDFIAKKTALFGMTRAGKSNTAKIIACEVFKHSRRQNELIGQLIFDPAGEYIHPNGPEDTALSLIGEEWVSIYKFGASEADLLQGIHPLQINFFDEAQRPLVKEVIAAELVQIDAGYINAFINAPIEDPDPNAYQNGANNGDYRKDLVRSSRGRFAFYALLANAGFTPSPGWPGIWFTMKNSLIDKVEGDLGQIFAHKRNTRVCVNSRGNLMALMTYFIEHAGTETEAAEWSKTDPFKAVKNVYTQTGGTAGLNRLKGLREFHNPNARSDYRDEIYKELADGKLVLVDISQGTESVVQNLSERIVDYLLAQANEKFRQHETLDKIQIYVEEAHRLFERSRYNSNPYDPWVRLAKEAAKFDIGLIYATQEVSSVENRILSNTHNWLISHLNSNEELFHLAKYYDFAAFTNSILKSEDVGYARMKTYSNKYIVPIQISLFDHDRVNEARRAAGLPDIIQEDTPLDAI